MLFLMFYVPSAANKVQSASSAGLQTIPMTIHTGLKVGSKILSHLETAHLIKSKHSKEHRSD